MPASPPLTRGALLDGGRIRIDATGGELKITAG